MIRDQRPDVFLIQETKMRKDKSELISFGKRLRCMVKDLEGASGGLLTIWKDSLEATTIFNEGNILLIKFFNPSNQTNWFLLNLYAPNTRHDRRLFWTKI